MKSFSKTCITNALDMHDFNLVISHFSLANVYGGFVAQVVEVSQR
jgi:hypothetical protein